MARRRRPFIINGETVELFAPGLNLIRAEPYWIPTRPAVDAGFQPRTVKLHYDLRFCIRAETIEVIGARSELERLAHRCAVLTTEMRGWLKNPVAQGLPVYNGTLASLIECYQRDPQSAYWGLEENTRGCYDGWCKTLVRACGTRRVDRLTGRDLRNWFASIMEPVEEGRPPRVRLAKGCVRQMMPILLNYGAELNFRNCAELAVVLERMTLRVPRDVLTRWKAMKPKKIAMRYEHASAIVDKGLAKGTRRHRSVAIGVAAQFEMTLAQIDYIGKWETLKKARNLGKDDIVKGTKIWRPGLRYEDFMPSMVLDMTRSKTSVAAIYDLNEYPLFMRALAAVPTAERTGPVAVSDSGEPFKKRYYHRLYAELATAADVPKGVWNMTARHGGGTEARKAGVPIEDTSEHLQHANPATTKRFYIEPNVETTRRVARARVAHRAKANG